MVNFIFGAILLPFDCGFSGFEYPLEGIYFAEEKMSQRFMI